MGRGRIARRTDMRIVTTTPLSAGELERVDRYWRAANYLSVGQIYLMDNPLLREPLQAEHVKPRLLGHWGTTPGLNILYAHLNRIIRARAQQMIYVTGPGHGGPGLVANVWLEGTYSEVYPHVGRDGAGMKRLFTQFSFHVAGYPAGEGELGEQPLHAGPVPADVRVHLAVGPLQPDVGHQSRPAVAGPGHVDHLLGARPDDPVQVGVQDVQPGRGAPVPEQARLDVLRLQGLAKQRVVHQVDLADRQVVGGPPVPVDALQLPGGQRRRGHNSHVGSPRNAAPAHVLTLSSRGFAGRRSAGGR